MGRDPRPGRVPPVAAPVRVPRRHHPDRDRRLQLLHHRRSPSTTGRHDPRGLAGVFDAVEAVGRTRRLGRWRRIRPRRGGSAALDRQVGDRDRAALARDRTRLPGRRSSDRCRSRRDLRHRHGGRDVPMVRAERPVPRVVPARARPPTWTSGAGAARRSCGHQGPAWAVRAGREAGGPGGIGRLHAAPDQDRCHRARTGAVPLRQAVREEPRARGPLVQARPDDPVRRAGGREALPVRPAVRRVRGLHAAPAAASSACRSRVPTASSRSPPNAST